MFEYTISDLGEMCLLSLMHYKMQTFFMEGDGVLLISLDCVRETLQKFSARKGNSSLFQRKAE